MRKQFLLYGLLSSVGLGAGMPWALVMDKPETWPFAINSSRYPLTVHYTQAQEQKVVRESLQILEHSWQIQIETLGFPPPIPSDNTGQSRLRVYLKRDSDSGVEGARPARSPEIWWDAYESYISTDPWGEYGEAMNATTLTHEFNHALQAALDWHESPGFFEASATYIQDKVYPGENSYLEEVEEFQVRPEWAIAYHDNYDSWYSYGSSLYLHFLEAQYFKKQPQFLAQIWRGARNAPRPLLPDLGIPAPASNEPDWIDALEKLLPPGQTYLDTVLAFGRWRYYTGSLARPGDFHDARYQGEKGQVKIAQSFASAQGRYSSVGPQLTGSVYLTFRRPPRGYLNFKLTSLAPVRWVLQAVPGLGPESSGETITGRLDFGNLPERTLIITALPSNGSYDPDGASAEQYPFGLVWQSE